MRKLRVNLVQKLLYLAAALCMLMAPSVAQIPRTAFKGITEHYMPGKEFYSHTLGMAALESGLIYNLRFYGNFIPAYDKW